jgi:hypothetical protein
MLRTALAGAGVLKAENPDAQRCYENALEARGRAQKARDPLDRGFYLAAEQRWLRLAESFQYSARLSVFLKQPRNLPNYPICATCDVPMWMRKMDFAGGQILYHYECPACEATETVTQAIPQRSG